MIVLDIAIPPAVIAAFTQMIEETSKVGSDKPVVESRLPEEDEDMDSYWHESLLAQLREDCDELLKQLGSFKEDSHHLKMTQSQAESLLRASSAIRLKIRDLHLGSIPDHDLEYGIKDFEAMPLKARRGYMCYSFLASLQATLIIELESSGAGV